MKFEKILNTTFIALIPKKVGGFKIRDFRPISLVNCVYKIIINVLANRMSVVMMNIISKSQNAFVKSRQIFELTFIFNECLNSRLKSSILDILIKLDIKKIFDYVY